MRNSAHSAPRRESTSLMRKMDGVHIDREHGRGRAFPRGARAAHRPLLVPRRVVVRRLGAELVTPLRGAGQRPIMGGAAIRRQPVEGILMPFRTMTTLQAWVDDFRALGYDDASILRVIPQDSEDGADAGLIAAQLKSVSTTFFVAPGPEQNSTEWAVTFEPREDAAPLPAGRVMALSGELATLSALCSFLQARSEAFLANI